MIDSEKHKQFIELRAAGQSYNRIAKKLNVSKPTLLKWSRKHETDIKNAKAFELEAIREEYLLTRRHRLSVLGKQLCKLNKEILKRDLTEVPAWRLIDMQQKITAEIEKDPEDIELTEDTNFNDYINYTSKKTVNWKG